MASKTTLTVLTVAACVGLGAFGVAAQDGGIGYQPGIGMGRGPDGASSMPSFETMDADGDGQITRAEIAALRKDRVLGIDTNGDGKLSAEELTAAEVRRMTERAAARSARMIEMMDVDGDGLLSVEELLAGPGPMRMFDRMDTNGDGVVTQAEAERATRRMQQADARQGREGRPSDGGRDAAEDRGQRRMHHGGDGVGRGQAPAEGSGSN